MSSEGLFLHIIESHTDPKDHITVEDLQNMIANSYYYSSIEDLHIQAGHPAKASSGYKPHTHPHIFNNKYWPESDAEES